MTDFTPLDRVLTNPNQRVILQVSDGAHWIKLTGKKGKDWKAIDPWTGKDCLVLATYRNITGYAIFEDIDKTQVATAQMNNTLAKRLAGRLLICPDQRGRLYYVDINGKLQGLGTTPEEVQQKAGKLALGISAVDISSLPWGDGSVAK